MAANSQIILDPLNAVESERRTRADTPGLEAQVIAIKRYQQRRFCHTYADLLESSRYGAASRFFLDELYGPEDFTQRDAQFARVVPALVRIFPREIVETVATLAALHALSEKLDTEMGRHVRPAPITAQTYIDAWQSTGRPADREEQIRLTSTVAGRLDRLTRNAVIRNSLRLMRGPARAAGLADLQLFLETGFSTFRDMKGAQEFTSIVESRERNLAAALFSAERGAGGIGDSISRAQELLPPEPSS